MSTLKKKIVWAVVLLISLVGAFVGGSVIGSRLTIGSVLTEFKKVNAPVVLGHYTIYRDIAANFKESKESKYSDAKCSAELAASSMFDSLKECLADYECGLVIEKEVRKSAPEVLGEAPLEFVYWKSEGKIKSCKTQ